MENTKTRIVKQSQMTSECWSVQFFGLEKCKTCEFVNTKECGGKEIRKTDKNSNGIVVPLGKEWR